MAYFKDADEVDGYEATYCVRCIHDNNCVIMDIHEEFEDANDSLADEILDKLIPINNKGENGKCRMFKTRHPR